MLAVSQRRFDLLLFWKLDKLSREGTRKTLQYLTRRTKAGLDRARRAGKVLGRTAYAVDMKTVRAKQGWSEPAWNRSGPWRESGSASKTGQGEMTRVQTRRSDDESPPGRGLLPCLILGNRKHLATG
jgi:hypothetical protein